MQFDETQSPPPSREPLRLPPLPRPAPEPPADQDASWIHEWCSPGLGA